MKQKSKQKDNGKVCIIMGNKKRPTSRRPYGYFEFYPLLKGITTKINGKDIKEWFIDSYFVDDDLPESIEEGRFAFRVSVKFISPHNPLQWKSFIIENLIHHTKKVDYSSTPEEIYDYLLSASIVLITYSAGDCKYQTAQECRDTGTTYCKKRHGHHYSLSPEISLVGYDSDDPDVPDDYRFVHMIPLRQYERTPSYMDKINYMKTMHSEIKTDDI